jgi:uncharacterized protein
MTQRNAVRFTQLTFLISWLLFGSFTLLGGKRSSVSGTIVLVIYMWIPAVVAIFMQRVVNREPLKLLGLKFRFNRWLVLAWLFPILAIPMIIGISAMFPGVGFDPMMTEFLAKLSTKSTEGAAAIQSQLADLPVHVIWVAIAGGLVAGPTINSIASFGEELGWRGYLQREFAYLGFWRSSFVIGAIWGLWHAPVILSGHNYPDHPVAGVFLMVIFNMVFSPVISYCRIRSGTIWSAVFLHGVLNAVGAVPLMVISGSSDLTSGFTGLAGILTMTVVIALVYLHDRYVAHTRIDDMLAGTIARSDGTG